ncbi:MAG: glutamate synthase-related protein [Candidatus Thorarchaeota archaeon]
MTGQVHKQLVKIGEDKDVSSILNIYNRFSIQTSNTPPRIKPPHPFIPRVSKPRLAVMLVRELLKTNIKLLRKEYRRALLSRPCIYGVFNRPVGGFYPIRELCTGCMRCVLEYPHFCKVERNPEYAFSRDSYWKGSDPTKLSYSPKATINYEAETGNIPIKGMGYKGAFVEIGWDSMWTDMSEIVRPTRDGVHGREYISTTTNIGRKPKYLKFMNSKLLTKSKTVEIPLPIIFDYLPPSMSNKSVQGSIKTAASNIGTFYIDKGSKSNYDDQPIDPFMIPLISPLNYNNRSVAISEARVLELLNFTSNIYEDIKSVNPHVSLIVRLPFKKGIEETSVELAQKGVDALHLYANYHGEEFEERKPRFVKDLIRRVHSSLIETGLRDEITIIVSGGITLAEHVPKAIICGADLIAIDTVVLVALQCQFEGECFSSETGGILKENFQIKWGSQRLINLLASWHDQLIEILSAMGMRDVRRLRGDTGRAMFHEDLEKEAFGDIVGCS